MIKRESIQKVIDRADIVDVVGQFLNLKKRGANYIGLCPFHNEKTPSFNVNPARGIYKCFGCGKGGDAVSFIEEYEKFSFIEAVRWLADYYQMELEETEMPDEYKAKQKIEESLRIINDFAADYFHKNLSVEGEGKIVGKGYFTERGFTDSTIEKFQLGYCLDQWDAFTNEALSKGYDLDLLEKSGLVKTTNNKSFDNYKGRAIFPIFSATGKILGFGARILKNNEKAPKYINSPENELYVKNKILYGLYHARQAIRKQDECLLVEGYADVISLSQGGVENVVASSGTSLTEGQLKLISNLSKNLTFLYDGDAAGIKAAMRGLDLALENGFRVKLVLLPEGQDPDDLMQKEGAQAFQEFIEEHKRDIIEFYLETGLKEAQDDPIKKSNLVSEIAETLSKINKADDFSLQQFYIKNSAEKLNIDEQGLIDLVNKFIREDFQKKQRQKNQDERQEARLDDTSDQTIEQIEAIIQDKDAAALVQVKKDKELNLLKVLLKYGDKPYQEDKTVAHHFFENIDLEVIEDTLIYKVLNEYYNYWNDNNTLPDEDVFIKHSDKSIRHLSVDIFYEKYEPSKDWKEKYGIEVPYGEEVYLDEVKSTFDYFELKFIRQMIEENGRQIEEEQKKENLDENKMQALLKTHLSLKQREKILKTLVILK